MGFFQDAMLINWKMKGNPENNLRRSVLISVIELNRRKHSKFASIWPFNSFLLIKLKINL